MIDLDSVEVTINKKLIVEDVVMNADEGQFVGIIGPNGSGKSTLLKAVYRVLKPTAGAIYIDGTDIKECTLKESALKTAVVPQHSYSSFDFKVRDIVLMGRSPHKKSMEFDNDTDLSIADECLEKVGMTEFAERNFSSLSGGEQQRIVLARALAQQTKCMVLDEPTNHLDVKYQLQLMDVVKSLGVTVLSALHDLNIAAEYCDKLYMMKAGHVYTYGTPEEVLTAENIKKVYDVDAIVETNPHTGRLSITYISERTKRMRQSKE